MFGIVLVGTKQECGGLSLRLRVEIGPFPKAQQKSLNILAQTSGRPD